MKLVKNYFIVALLFFSIGFSITISKVKALDYSELNLDPGEEVVAETTKYYKTVTVVNNSKMMMKADLGTVSSFTTEVTKEEFDNAPTDAEKESGISTQDVFEDYGTETNYKKLSSIISKYGSRYFRYRAILEWKNMPKTRSYDIIGVGFYASVKIASTIDLYNEYCREDGTCANADGYYIYNGLNGGAAVFHLPSGDITSLKQTLLVEVEKTNPNSTIIEQVCVADYSHATKTISYNNAKKFKVDTGGITLNGVESYYDTMPTAPARWEGTW